MQKQGTDATNLPIPIYLFKRIPFLLTARSAVKRAMKIVGYETSGLFIFLGLLIAGLYFLTQALLQHSGEQ